MRRKGPRRGGGSEHLLAGSIDGHDPPELWPGVMASDSLPGVDLPAGDLQQQSYQARF
jgi:hypothetical protein